MLEISNHWIAGVRCVDNWHILDGLGIRGKLLTQQYWPLLTYLLTYKAQFPLPELTGSELGCIF